MPAESPYAPIRRNSFITHADSSVSLSSHSGKHTALVALLLFVVRFWKEVANRKKLWNLLKRQPYGIKIIQWISTNIFRKPHDYLITTTKNDDDDDTKQSQDKSLLLPNNITIEKNDVQLKVSNKDDSPIKQTSRFSFLSWEFFMNESSMNLGQQQLHQSQLSSSSSLITIKRIQENQKLIKSVLQYWFGQYSPEMSQKMLWMIASSSVQLRTRVDHEISNKFCNLLIELSMTESIGRWFEWCYDDNDIYGFDGKIAAIIVLDQFSRHIQRHYENNNDDRMLSSSSLLPPQAKLDELALKTATLFVDCHKDQIRCGMIPLPQYIFSLMPFRHASTLESVKYVQDCIEECTTMHEQMDAMIRRFRKATNRRMAVIQDKARRTGTSTNSSSDDNNSETGAIKADDNNSITFKDEDILETFPFEADLCMAANHPVIKTIINFLNDRGIYPHRKGQSETTSVKPIIVSLSGGVDSMVIASVLSHLKQSNGYPLFIIAVHIDYANRPESGAEADYVRRYCDKLGITFQCRRIDEVTRGVTARDDYERIARDIRYDSYREALALAASQIDNSTSSSSDVEEEVGVMLGHHRGDLRENVLSNSHKGCGPLDLSGMTAISQNDGITIYRPLLPLEKSFVLDYAHKFGVPYFKDTTPHWSTRGKLRNKLLPLLQEIYGEGSMNNLSTLATESDECRALLHKSMLGPFLDQVTRKPMGIMFETSPWKSQGTFFWKFVLREALHSAGLGMFSDKSTMNFLERVQAEKVREGWLQCRRDYAVYLQGDGKIYILYPSSFPWRKADSFKTPSNVNYGEENAVDIGPWTVMSELVNVTTTSSCPDTFRLAQKAMPTMDHLMDGQIEYYVSVPTWQEGRMFVPRPLIFCPEFNKASRPLAWKNTDLKVQSTLPLLGNDDVATNAMKDLTGCGLVHEDENKEIQVNPVKLVKVTLKLNT